MALLEPLVNLLGGAILPPVNDCDCSEITLPVSTVPAVYDAASRDGIAYDVTSQLIGPSAGTMQTVDAITADGAPIPTATDTTLFAVSDTLIDPLEPALPLGELDPLLGQTDLGLAQLLYSLEPYIIQLDSALGLPGVEKFLQDEGIQGTLNTLAKEAATLPVVEPVIATALHALIGGTPLRETSFALIDILTCDISIVSPIVSSALYDPNSPDYLNVDLDTNLKSVNALLDLYPLGDKDLSDTLVLDVPGLSSDVTGLVSEIPELFTEDEGLIGLTLLGDGKSASIDGATGNLLPGSTAPLLGDGALTDTLLGDNGSADRLIGEVTTLGDALLESALGTDLDSADAPVDELTTDVQDLLAGEDVSGTLTSLLGPNGSVDQVIAGTTSLAGGTVSPVLMSALGSDLTALEAVDAPVDELTTDVQEIITGDQQIGEGITSLLGPNGSVDQVVDGVTTAGTELIFATVPVDLNLIDGSFDAVTSDVDDLLAGTDTTTETLNDLLGPQGSVDVLADDLTTALTPVVDLNPLDPFIDDTTTFVQDNVLAGLTTGLDTVSTDVLGISISDTLGGLF